MNEIIKQIRIALAAILVLQPVFCQAQDTANPSRQPVYLTDIEMAIALNMDQIVPGSIANKALSVIDYNVASQQWMIGTYDYRTRVLEAQLPWLIGAIIMALAMLTLLLVILYRRHNEGKRLEKLVTERTNEISEANLRTEKLFESLDTLILITESESDNIVFFNEKMKKAFHLTDSNMGEKCWKVFHGSDQPGEQCSFCQKNDPALNSGGSVTVENFYPKINRHFKVICRYIKWGSSKGFLQQYYDITEIKNSIAKMQETDEYTQLLLDATPMSCTLWNREPKIINCNQEAIRLFEAPGKDELTERFMYLAPEFQPNGERSVEATYMYIEKAFKEGYVCTEWMHETFSGTPLPCEAILVRVRHRDEYMVAGFSRDLREYKAHLAKMEKAQENLRLARDAAEAASRTKTIFLANMSHEIRTPMNSIIGFAELAQYGDIEPKTREYLGNITESAEWLLKIINDILDISKIESGKITLEHTPFDLHDIVAYCHSAIKPKTDAKGIALYFYAEPSIGKKLLGDPIRLRQALMNLLSNSVKFTNTGTIKLLTSIARSDDRSVTVSFEVKDSGIGMSPEQLDRIFEPFMQADNSITRRFGGTGLGLPITKKIIELMGGTLHVESMPGIGSKFGFEVTFNVADDTDGIQSQRTIFNNGVKPNFGATVLVCEDNPLNQQVICEHLARVGINTVIAHNGSEGVDIVSKHLKNGEKLFDLIFMDIHMPVMDGLEAASKIAGLGVKTPIVAVTANLMSNDLELYRANGMSDYLGKPFTAQDLVNCLKKYLPVDNYSSRDRNKEQEEEEKTLKQLQICFVNNNKTTYTDIMTALNGGNNKLAHRLAHSLKSNAGMIGEKGLNMAAAAVENLLSEGNNLLDKETSNILLTELKSVMDKLTPLMAEAESKIKTEIVSIEKAREIIRKLEPMLQNRNPECINLLDEIRGIPEAEELAIQIEKFRFKQALVELSKLKKDQG